MLSSRWAWRIAATIGAVLSVIILSSALASAVSEESIGSSPVRQTAAPANPSAVRPAEAPPEEQVTTPPATTEAPSSAAPRTVQPRATFPYTVREGDTLGSIAEIFGLSVSDLSRVNRVTPETELMVGDTLRIPNPGLTRERELTTEVNQLALDQQSAEERARQSEAQESLRLSEINDLKSQLREVNRDVRGLAWWRGSAYVFGVIALLMFGAMTLAMLEWWFLRSRFLAVAEMNESLRRLDYKYKAALAKAELRLQELYGRRRRGIHDGQERPKLAEETEIERLNLELKTVLERHLARLRPSGSGVRWARLQERVGGVGSPVEARPARR